MHACRSTLEDPTVDKPELEAWCSGIYDGLAWLALAAPVAIFLGLWRRRRIRPPMIVPLLIASNAIWWIGFSYLAAFTWATVFHGIQYLALVLRFHVAGSASAWRRGVVAYSTCLVLGYLLFRSWPYAYEALGWSYAPAVMIVASAINLHHFIVDAFIWRREATA